MFGESCFGETCFAEALTPIGVVLVPEIALPTRELVLVVEIDLIQPNSSSTGSAATVIGPSFDNSIWTMDSTSHTMDEG